MARKVNAKTGFFAVLADEKTVQAGGLRKVLQISLFALVMYEK